MKQWQKTVLIGVPATFGMAAIGFYVWANQPVTVHPKASSPPPSVLADRSPQTLSGERFKVTVNGDYIVRTQDFSGPGNVLERLVATETERGSGQIAITISRLPQGGLHEVSDVRLRQQQTDLYLPTTVAGLPEGSLAFRSTGQYELDAFWIHGDYYAAIALTNTQGSGSVYDTEFEGIIQNWQWL